MDCIKPQAFITIKNDKSSFQNNSQYILLNPTKNNVGKVNKFILESASKQNSLGVNHNIKDATVWFRKRKETVYIHLI